MMIVPALPPLPSGGAELQALRLGAELREKGADVSFLTPGKRSIRGRTSLQDMPVYRLYSVFSRAFEFFSDRKKEGKTEPVTIEFDDSKGQFDQIASKVGLPTVIYYNIFFWQCFLFLWPRRKSFDIIHAHTMEWSAIVAARLGHALGKPVLIKDSTMNGFASLARFPAGDRLQEMIVARAHFVAMTKAIRENLRTAGVPGEKISLIPNGIAVDGPMMPAACTDGLPRVLFVGNLYQQPAKGVDILLKAWTRVTRQYPAALLQIVGDGDLPAYLDFAKKLGIGDAVRFYGKQSGLPAYYSDATLFVLPSRREGMSNALMEAMLHSLPCVATDISGSQDLLESGVNGLLVPPMDADKLAAAICYLLGHPDEALEMGKKARTTILQRTDIDVVAEQYLSLYKRLIISRTAEP
jgi:glycosyltransferase involved in cell wall biosynthesis